MAKIVSGYGLLCHLLTEDVGVIAGEIFGGRLLATRRLPVGGGLRAIVVLLGVRLLVHGRRYLRVELKMVVQPLDIAHLESVLLWILAFLAVLPPQHIIDLRRIDCPSHIGIVLAIARLGSFLHASNQEVVPLDLRVVLI